MEADDVIERLGKQVEAAQRTAKGCLRDVVSIETVDLAALLAVARAAKAMVDNYHPDDCMGALRDAVERFALKRTDAKPKEKEVRDAE